MEPGHALTPRAQRSLPDRTESRPAGLSANSLTGPGSTGFILSSTWIPTVGVDRSRRPTGFSTSTILADCKDTAKMYRCSVPGPMVVISSSPSGTSVCSRIGFRRVRLRGPAPPARGQAHRRPLTPPVAVWAAVGGGVAVLPRRRDRAPWAGGGPRGGAATRRPRCGRAANPGSPWKTTRYLKKFRLIPRYFG